MKGLHDMKTMLRKSRLPAPVVPEPLRPQVFKIGDWLWGSREVDTVLYDLSTYVEEAATHPPPNDYFMLGHAGYGVNNWFLHCYLHHGPLSVFIQTPWGGAYAESKLTIDAVQRRFAVLERLMRAADEALMAGKILPGRLIIQQSAIEPPRWAWSIPDQPLQWQEEFANAMTPAMEALQAVG